MARPRLSLRGLVLFGGILTLLVGWILVSRDDGLPSAPPPRAASSDVLQAVPADAILALRIDVTQLRDSPLGGVLLAQGREIAGLGQLQQLCGRDPLDSIEQLAIAVPARNDTGFGIFARGTFTKAALLACAEHILLRRQGRPLRQPQGNFSVLRDAHAKADAAALAVSDGLLLIAEPSYLAESLSVTTAVGHRQPLSILDHPEHAAVHLALQPAAITATAVLSDALRATLRDELRAQKMADSPFASIRAAGASLHVGKGLRLHVVLRCDDAPQCAAAAHMIDRVLRDEARSSRAGHLGVRQMLTDATVAPQGSDVHIRAALSAPAARQLLNKLTLLDRLSALASPLDVPPPLTQRSTSTSPAPTVSAPLSVRLPLHSTPATSSSSSPRQR